ncbi:hypothetical protein PULV_b0894 [Pseudoalteromonas ulvae UL12]|nr:hypothetical protein [Pseudoalteromonas ulvae UL12]
MHFYSIGNRYFRFFRFLAVFFLQKCKNLRTALSALLKKEQSVCKQAEFIAIIMYF